jgi:eukaryotic-like serine/threonine-protein kinase
MIPPEGFGEPRRGSPMNHLLGERYRLGERIAGGGMGSVYRAVDGNLGRQVAVKVLRRELADDPTFLERFRREARAAAALSHPGVAGVYDYGELGGSAFIVMELVEGETLAERIAAIGRLPFTEAFAIGEQVARALAAAHAHGLVHRDVKPANVLLGPGGAKVTDFGIAKAATAATLTRTGMVLGSANYVAPEQAQGDPVGPAADQYSLGCVLFEAVTGRTPYTGANPVAIATQHVSSPVPDPRGDLPDLPAPAADLIRRALAKHPADRFPSATALADALSTTATPGHGTQQAWGAQDAREPRSPLSGPPEGERSPVASGVPRAVHSPPVGGVSPAVHRLGRVPRRGGRVRWPAVAAGTLVVIALLLLAWLPRGEPSDPPAGQSERPPPASPTTVDNGDEDD